MAKGTQGLSAIAQRYATALYELADSSKALDDVAEDLRALRQLLVESDDLVRLIRSPILGREQQAKAMDAVMDKAGANALTRKFLGTVANNRRLFALNNIIDAFLNELARRRGEVTAEVTSAKALTKTQEKALTDALKQAIGTKVAIETKVEPALIGGLIVKVGSRMIDSSLRSKLQRLQLAMKGTA
ncbi:F0F1 ATP synthase subunit delta [Oceanibaculum pacificum]|uniref:ATP synthase subunit delta n=1 Tax=Oceanibaculum pacificum TaxID=580166 RepID=A0A154W4K0_9PROT|nr:F0F1 ATP synthase subunit delta [Oceanibaculum pacificum]KZD08381.1 ATP synthase subunit delta [Oceanibaculum pacificum]